MKYLKRALITLGIVFLMYIGISYGVVYLLARFNISIQDKNYDFPATLHLSGISVDQELFSAKIDRVDFSWSWTGLLNGKLESRLLSVSKAEIQLNEDNNTSQDSTETFSMNLPFIEFQEILLKEINIQSEGKSDTLKISFPELKILDLSFDKTLKIDSLINKKNHIYFAYSPDLDEKKANESSSGFEISSIPEFSINALDFEKWEFKLINPSQKHSISNLNLDLHGFKSTDLLDLGINTLSFKYQDTLDIAVFLDDVHFNNQNKGKITNFVLDFPGLHLDLPLISYSNDNGLNLKVISKVSTLNSRLINVFQPDLELPLNGNIEAQFNGEITYSNENLSFKQFVISLPDAENSSLEINGIAGLKGIQDQIQIEIADLQTSLSAINKIYPLQFQENQPSLKIQGDFQLEGTYKDLALSAKVLANSTRINLNSTIDQSNPETAISFNLLIPFLDPAQLGNIIPAGFKANQISLSGNTLLDTSGIPLHSKVSLESDSVFVKDKWYSHPEIIAEQDKELTSLLVDAQEEQIKFFIETHDDIFQFEQLSFEGFLKSNVPDPTDFSQKIGEIYSSFNGNFSMKDADITAALLLDSLQFNSPKTSYLSNASLFFSKDETAGMQFSADLDSAEMLRISVANEVFDWLEMEDNLKGNYPEASLDLNLEIDSTFISDLTGLNAYVNLNKLHISTFGDSIISALNISQLNYEDFLCRDITSQINAAYQTIDGNVAITNFENPYSDLNNLSLDLNTGKEGTIGVAISTWVPEIENDFKIACLLKIIDDNLMVKLDDSRPLEFGDEIWKSTNNQGIIFSSRPEENSGNIAIESQQQKIAVKAASETYEIIIDSLNLKPIFNALTLDYDFKGFLNLDTKYSLTKEELSWEGNIAELAVDSIGLGKLNFNGLNQPEELRFYASSNYKESEINLSVTKKEDPVDFNINLKEFNLYAFSRVFPFWPESIDVAGFLNANVEGSYEEELHAKGFVFLENTQVTMAEYGLFTQVNDSILFDDTDFIFQNFKLLDVEGNSLIVNGKYSVGVTSPIDLRLSSNQFKLLEKNDKNGDIRGEVDIATKLSIKGDPEDLSISGNINTLPNSNIFYKYKSSVSLEEREKVISFTSFDEEEKFTPIKIQPRGKPINWNVDFNIGKTDIYILLYETTQDYIRMVAQGNLQLRKGIGDQPWIFGAVESTEGSVYYDAPMVSDLNLKIEKAAIRWDGEFDKPRIDFRGSEVFRVSPSELTAGVGDKKNRAPVTVLAMVDNKLLNEFDLRFDLKSNNSEIASSLQKLPTSTRETYAINLLLFGKIDPSAESGGSSYMQGLVSKLNEITRRNLKNADLSFYMDSSNETDLSSDEKMNRFGYSYSQGLFHKRVRLSLGGNIDLGNNTPNHIQKFNPLGTVQVEYILSEKPYISIIGARRNAYTGAIDGQVDKASLGLSYQKRFQNFFRIFSKKKKVDEQD